MIKYGGELFLEMIFITRFESFVTPHASQNADDQNIQNHFPVFFFPAGYLIISALEYFGCLIWV
jgi:hypothetical protein